MKKYLPALSLLIIMFALTSNLHAQLLYQNTDQNTYLFANQINAFTGNTVSVVLDDVEIPEGSIGTNDSISITKVKIGIARESNAPACTFTLCYAPINESGTGPNTDTSYLTIPIKEVASVSLPALGITDSTITTIISFGDSTNRLFSVKVPAVDILSGQKTFYLGLKFTSTSRNNTNGWVITTPTQSQNIDRFWIYNPAVPKRFSLGFSNDNPKATMYIQVFGKFTLPVTFMNFDGVLQNNQAVLNWSTSNEINNKGYEIQKSVDGQTFADIGFVQGAGSSSSVNKYTFSDAKLLSGSNYYRLKQIDFDGRFSYSSTIKLDFSKFNWTILGNPSRNSWIQLQIDKPANISIQIISLNGKIIQTINKGNISQGTYSVPINLSNFAPGIYIVKLIADNQTYSKKIIK